MTGPANTGFSSAGFASARFDRRAMIRGAAASMLALSAAAIICTRAAAQARASFAPPAAPLIYSRQLLRIMAGGARFMVARSFAVHFTPDGDGYLLAGTQSSVEVEAPPALARFVALEKARVETGLFPLRLDGAGQIRAAAGPADAPSPPNAGLAAAVAAAQVMAAQMGGTVEAQAQRAAFINAIHQSATQLVTELPTDLFAPQRLDRTERQDLALPGDLQGHVTAQFVASVDPMTGLMRSASRSVVTAIGDDRRETIESWTLKPA